jgi:HEAT repeat protein
VIIALFLMSQTYDFEKLYNTATTLLVQFQEEQKAAFDTLVALGQDSLYKDTTLAFLVDQFDTKSASERHRLKDIFKAIGFSSIPAIVSRLDYRGSDAEDRHLSQALWVLGEIGGDSIVDPVSRFARDSSWHIRSSAFTALGKSKSAQARDFILLGLNDTITPVRKSAFYALSEIASTSDIPYFAHGINDPYYGVRYAAVKGLVALDSSAHATLIDLAGLSDHGMFYAVHGLLDSGGSEAAVKFFDPSAPLSVRFLIYNACENVDDLKTWLEQEEETILQNCIRRKITEVEKKSDK